MKAVVIDASAVVAVLFGAPPAREIARLLREAEGNVYAPHLLDVEVARVLRRHAAEHPEQEPRCREALLDLREMPVLRQPLEPFLERFWDLCRSIPVSDAAYLALAEYLEAPLLTCDIGLKRAGHDAEVVVVQ